MLESVGSFINYFGSIRRRTRHFVQAIPDDRLGWAPAAGAFSFGELIGHIAAEAMFVGAAVEGRWGYAGHRSEPAATLQAAAAALDAGHRRAIAALGRLPDAALAEHRPSLDGPPVRVWRLLMATVEHEIHHRSQLAMDLALIGVTPPHIYGLGVEDVIARATG